MGPRPAFTSLMMQWLRRQVGIGLWVRCETSGSRYSLPTIFCSSGKPLGFVLLAQAVLRIGLQVKEVGADRAITVLEAREHDAIFHLRHLGAGIDHEAVGGRG